MSEKYHPTFFSTWSTIMPFGKIEQKRHDYVANMKMPCIKSDKKSEINVRYPYNIRLAKGQVTQLKEAAKLLELQLHFQFRKQ